MTTTNTKHPTVYKIPADVLRARDNVQRFAWAKKMAGGIKKSADEWLARDDAWLRAQVPKAGAAFAYGFTGCPSCGSDWGLWNRAQASFDNPGHVTCAKGHVLPDAAHPDAGTGYVGPDGRIHYFVGSYNSWVVEMLTGAATNLADAYSLGGDERYAAKAAVILDALAAVYPACDKGSWDYPSNPPSGRFHRPWYQVARVLVIYTDQYDSIYHSASLDAPSVVPGLTRRKNIEGNLLRNGALYCYEQSRKSPSLTNGVADYVRGALAVGVCLDIPEYVRWAVDGPYGILTMLENNIDRDGAYYETSLGYSMHARSLYLSFSEPLFNYSGGAYPSGVNLYEHPKFRAMALLNLGQTLAGHRSAYGDSGPDTKRIEAPGRPFDAADYSFLERLYVRADDALDRHDLGELLLWLAGDDVESQRTGATDRWLLFHARPLPASKTPPLPAAYARSIFGSHSVSSGKKVMIASARKSGT